MSDWRQNSNLVECFDNWCATVRGLPESRPRKDSRGGELVRQRRIALGLSQHELGREAGYPVTSAGQNVSCIERNIWTAEHTPVPAALDRLEAERAQS